MKSHADLLAVGWHPAAWLIFLKEDIAFVLPLLGGWWAVLPLLRLRVTSGRGCGDR
jgi:hypothetical protein